MIDMKPCPCCGAMLTAALADAVATDAREETCPHTPPHRRPATVAGLLTTR